MTLARTRLWLISLFAICQFLLGLHSAQHEAVNPDNSGCEICAVAHAPPVPPAPLTFAATAIPTVGPVVIAALPVADRRPFARPNTRGPPLSLA